MNYPQVQLSLQNKSDPLRAQNMRRFFKTKPGQYAEDDQFIGIALPDLRMFAKQYKNLDYSELQILMASPVHEERLLTLLILTRKYKQNKQVVYQFYVDNLQHVNNWDLVDTSAHLIMGEHLLNQDKEILMQLASSSNLWNRRVAMVATWQFIRNNQFDWTIKIATVLLHDTHDLIHKAVGWMLREAGKRNQDVLLSFLNEHAACMPRTMLRYAIEKLTEDQRQYYLKAFSLRQRVV